MHMGLGLSLKRRGSAAAPAGYQFITFKGEQVTFKGDPVIARTGA